jgi:hypothetical protein
VERTLLSVAFDLDFDFDVDFEVERTPSPTAFEIALALELKRKRGMHNRGRAALQRREKSPGWEPGFSPLRVG